MNAEDIRKAYLDFFVHRGHKLIPRALLVPQNDPTTLFTGSGMQPLLPNLLGAPHPDGNRLTDSQTCFRSQDIEEVGDNRHTTFFEMLGNWSLGDYFKAEELPWFFEFLTKVVGLDPNKLYVTCFLGDPKNDLPKDTESAEIWKKLFEDEEISNKEVELGNSESGSKKGMPEGGRIFYYDGSENWWCRTGSIDSMPEGEPGGPASEVFYEFDFVKHNPDYGEKCHPNCDCGRYMEIGDSVFMEYVKGKKEFSKLPKRNIDFGGGLERISAAANNDPDVFKISLLWPIIETLEKISNEKYDTHTVNMRVIADHLRAATFLAADGVVPSNKTQGYVMRRLVRRAIRFAFELGIEQGLCERIIPIVAKIYSDDYPEVEKNRDRIIETLMHEEKIFRQTLRQGLRQFERSVAGAKELSGEDLFMLYDTYGFPVELTKEEAYKTDIKISPKADKQFDHLMSQQRERSRTATKGEFKGGLIDHSEITTKYHTATHLMYKALRMVLGEHVIQRGSNITAERLRFDFSNPEKVNPEQIKKVEDIVNQQIDKDWPMSWREENTKEALASGVMGAFGDRYGEKVKIYTVGDPDGENFSREICGGPHVEHTGQLGENSKKFKIIKEESSSSGVRRIKAVLQ